MEMPFPFKTGRATMHGCTFGRVTSLDVSPELYLLKDPPTLGQLPGVYCTSTA